MEYFLDIYSWVMSLDGWATRSFGLLILFVGGLILVGLTIYLIGYAIFTVFAFFIANPLGWLVILIFLFYWWGANRDPTSIDSNKSFVVACNRAPDCNVLLVEAARLKNAEVKPVEKASK